MSDPAAGVAAAGATERPAFDLRGPLPVGTTVLEASAGTGKTYTIAALAARWVVEQGVELGAVLMVTFGRNATDELRLRVRERLVRTEAQLARARADGRLPDNDDAVGRLLCTAGAAGLALRHTRVRRALADFDAATIATTHEFCLRMLDGLGVLGDAEPDAVFVERLGDLTSEVARDVFLRRYAARADPPLRWEDALGLARTVVEHGHTRLVPDPASGAAGPDTGPGDPTTGRRVAFAREVRDEVAARKAAGRLFGYDDMLTRLRDALADPRHGPAAAERLRHRYRVVLVDEFQDTDPVQWEILRRAFAGHTTLVLIGDPKQAIYAFRGADVVSYLDAVRQAEVQTLSTNWRSDAALTTAVDTLLGGAALGDPEIVVRPVRSAHAGRRLTPAGDGELPACRLRILPADPEAAEAPRVGAVRPRVEADLVADLTRLLAAPPRVRTTAEERDLRASDVAVLVRTNQRGESVRAALAAAGIPAVLRGSTSVFASPAAADWLTLLLALEQPRQALTRAAALTCFVGWTAADLATADDAAVTGLAQRIRTWSRVLAGRGVAALLEVAGSDVGLAERLLAERGGERTLTDVRHLAQALHTAMVAGRLGVSALVEWLRDRIAEARDDGWDEATRRLETDADAVQVLTVHRSKGLQFPVVYLPDAWDQFIRDRDRGEVLRLHADGECVLDVGGPYADGRRDRLLREQAESAGEELRLLYVALTRAECQVVAWWAATRQNTTSSALHRALCRVAPGEPERSYPLPSDPATQLRPGPGVTVELVATRPPVSLATSSGGTGPLAARRFGRALDLGWRRTSYSGLTRELYGQPDPLAGVASEAEPDKEDDENPSPSGAQPAGEPGALLDQARHPSAPAAGGSAPSPMQDLPGGAAFGSLVHAVYESVDPQAGDLAAELRTAVGSALARTGPFDVGVEALAAGLLPSFGTPLGPLAGGLRLADIPVRDRLTELDFELPLAGGDRTRATVHLGDLVGLLRRHLASDDPLVGYPAQLDHPLLREQTLRGFLTGSIDAVLRVPGPAGGSTYLVVDYKTNWLGSVDGPVLTLADYAPPRLVAAMLHAHYPLQALLYAVALHRMLRWRQPGYDPERHLGGVLYLFVRGMAGPDTPAVGGVPYGVFSWRPPAVLVTELSDLLDRGPR